MLCKVYDTNSLAITELAEAVRIPQNWLRQFGLTLSYDIPLVGSASRSCFLLALENMRYPDGFLGLPH